MTLRKFDDVDTGHAAQTGGNYGVESFSSLSAYNSYRNEQDRLARINAAASAQTHSPVIVGNSSLSERSSRGPARYVPPEPPSLKERILDGMGIAAGCVMVSPLVYFAVMGMVVFTKQQIQKSETVCAVFNACKAEVKPDIQSLLPPPAKAASAPVQKRQKEISAIKPDAKP